MTTLHKLRSAEGYYPYAGVIQATDSNFYGTAYGGGASNAGTIFKLDSAGTLITLHSFTGGGEGANPSAPLFQAADGNFYGTTALGGASNAGTIFKLDAVGTVTTLHSFTGGDGAHPWAGLIQATDGSFYGTAPYGGVSGVGTIFKLNAAGNVTTVHSFTGATDGASPRAAVIEAADGSFYGTTSRGGESHAGTVFKLDAEGTLTTPP